MLRFHVQDALLVFLLFPVHPLRLKRRVYRHWLHRQQQLSGDRGVDPRAAEGHAPRQPHHKVWLVAAIYRSTLRVARICDAQSSSASPAGHDARQKRLAAPARLHASGAAVIVEGELLLIALIFLPTEIAFVMILDHHLPCSDRLAMPVAAPRPSVDNGGAFLTFPVNVNSGVEGILENGNHIAVADRRPVEARHAALIRGTWEVDLIGFHREQNLARAAKFMEADENEANDLLET